MFSFCATSSWNDLRQSVPFAVGCEVGPEATVGACKSSILMPICAPTMKSGGGKIDEVKRWEWDEGSKVVTMLL